LRAYPAAYRAERQAELEGTLLEASEENGGPTLHEVVGLIQGGLAMRLGLKASRDIAAQLAFLSALLVLAAAFAPGRFWSAGDVSGFPVVAGPAPWMRLLLIATAVIAAMVSLGVRRSDPWPAWVGGALFVGLGQFLLLVGADLANSLLSVYDHRLHATPPKTVAYAAGVLGAVAVPLALAGLNRLQVRPRLAIASTLMGLTALIASFPVLGGGTGIAAIAVVVGAFLGLIATALILRREPSRAVS
jgi:hypothetical protein